MSKLFGILILVMVGIQVVGVMQTEIAVVTGTGGIFEATPAGALLIIIPLVLIAGLVMKSAWFTKS